MASALAMRGAARLFAVLLALSLPDPQHTLSARVGVASLRAEECHLAIDNDHLTTGTPVTLIELDAQEKPVTVSVAEGIEHPTWPREPLVTLPKDYFPPVYRLDCSSLGPEARLLGFGVIGFHGSVERAAGGIIADFSGRGTPEYGYSCATSESAQLIVRSAPKGQLLWRAAYYLGYDTVRTCTDADLK